MESKREIDMDIQPPQKKKRRTPLSCVSCRKRKVKCDRAKPQCNRCLRSNLSCEYDSPIDWNLVVPSNTNKSLTFVSTLNLNSHLGSTINNTTESENNDGNGSLITFDSKTECLDNDINKVSNNIDNHINNIGINNNNNTGGFMFENSVLNSKNDTFLSNNLQNLTNASPNMQFYFNGVSNGLPVPYSNVDSISISLASDEDNEGENNVNVDQLSNQIDKMKKELYILEKKLDTNFDRFSLVVDENNNNPLHFSCKKDSRFTCSGTLRRTVVWNRDPFMKNFLKKLWDLKRKADSSLKFGLKKKKNNKVSSIANYKTKNDGNDSENLIESSVNHTIPNNSNPEKLSSIEYMKKQVKTRKIKFSSCDESTFVERVQSIIPPWEIVQFHIENYLKTIYPFIPVLDEQIFRANILEILEYDEYNNKINRIIISTKLDYVRLSILLIILRSSYISIYLDVKFNGDTYSPNNNYNNTRMLTSTHSKILEFPIEPDSILLVNNALYTTNFLRKTSLEVLQLLLMLRFYQINAPEDGDGGDGLDGVVFNGLIYSTAEAVGLGRKIDDINDNNNSKYSNKHNDNTNDNSNNNKSSNDNSNSGDNNINGCNNNNNSGNNNNNSGNNNNNGNNDNCNNNDDNKINDNSKNNKQFLEMNLMSRGSKSFNYLWKKIWWSCLEIDCDFSLRFGKSMSFNIFDSDNTVPNFESFSSNLSNSEIDKFSIDRLIKFSKVLKITFKILNDLHSVRKLPKVVEIEMKLNELMKTCIDLYDNSFKIELKDEKYLSMEVDCLDRLNNLRTFIKFLSFKSMLDYYLLLHYEKTRNVKKFLKLIKLCVPNWIELTRLLLVIFNRLSTTYSKNCLVLCQLLIETVNRLMTIELFLAIRLLLLNYKSKNMTLIEITEKILKNLLIIMKTTILINGHIGEHFYNSMRSYAQFQKKIELFENDWKFVFDFDNLNNEQLEGNLIENLGINDFNNLNCKFEKFINSEEFIKLRNKKILWSIENIIKEEQKEENVEKEKVNEIKINEEISENFINEFSDVINSGDNLIDWEDINKWFTDTNESIGTLEFDNLFE